MNTEEKKQLVKDELDAEVSWLRSIDMQDEKDVRRAATELILSRKNSVMNQIIREIVR